MVHQRGSGRFGKQTLAIIYGTPYFRIDLNSLQTPHARSIMQEPRGESP